MPRTCGGTRHALDLTALGPAFLVLLAGCSLRPSAATPPPLDPPQAVVRRLEPGAVVRLVTAQGAIPSGATVSAADGLFREAMRQSAYLDIAAGPLRAAAAAPACTVRLVFADGVAQAFVQDGDAAFSLASPTASRHLCETLDELALRLRLALGDPTPTAPTPLERAYSRSLQAVDATERAIDAAHHGSYDSAYATLAASRRLDGACALLLEATASVLLLRGEPDGARRLCEEALRLERRQAPTTTHRLLRTLLLARASGAPELARRYDEELWTLAQVAGRERPFDPDVRFSLGIAENFRGRFDQALAALEPLAQRLPEHGGVAYHLGWAALGSGRADEAARAFARAALSLPRGAVVVPRAMALLRADRQRELEELLTQLGADAQVRASPAYHEVLRMRAAHELLRGRPSAAAGLMYEDLDWLFERPSLLEHRAAELAEMAEILTRIGHGDRMRPLLARALEGWPNHAIGDAAAYGLGLLESTATRQRARSTVDLLHRRGAACWAHALAAFGHRQAGELLLEQQELAQAARLSASPLCKRALIENLQALGRADEAQRLAAALRREMLAVDLRRRSQHPLLAPELAYAYLAP
jgi:tetratricopeptide (TPR) repeat protein